MERNKNLFTLKERISIILLLGTRFDDDYYPIKCYKNDLILFLLNKINADPKIIRNKLIEIKSTLKH